MVHWEPLLQLVLVVLLEVTVSQSRPPSVPFARLDLGPMAEQLVKHAPNSLHQDLTLDSLVILKMVLPFLGKLIFFLLILCDLFFFNTKFLAKTCFSFFFFSIF